ncbi:S8 family serine peptidase [Streptomyces sp. NPDC054956]
MGVEKLAPSLVAVYERYVREERRRTPLLRSARMTGLVSVQERAKPLRVVVSLECEPGTVWNGGGAPLEGVEIKGGIYVNGGGRRVRTAIVELDAVPDLAALPGVRRIVPAARLRPTVDRALKKVHVPAFRNRTGLTGRGVLLGTVDTGIDARHRNFDGRIDRIWDQTLRGGSGVPEGDYGMEFRGADLAGPLLSRDVDGHGTHVAGIAAGTEGVAPDATIVAVKTDFDDAHIIDGIQYVFRVAGDLGLPAVVNLSLGGHSDPHDGTDLMSLAIEEESGPGRIVCCAAGNEGDDDIHAAVELATGEVKSVPCHPGRVLGSPAVFWLNGWYPGTDRLEVAVVSPAGDSTPFQAVHAVGNPEKTYELAGGTVQIVTPGTDPGNGDHNFFVGVEPSAFAAAAPLSAWRLVLKATSVGNGVSRADVWMLGHPDAEPKPQFSGPLARDEMKIGSPGTATHAITVAASTTRTEWTDIDGIQREATWLVANDIASFSSEGPRRDGAHKPDIAAPGAMIVSALSRDAVGLQRALMIDREHLALQGTSMACPFVAGVAALLLEQDGSAKPKQVLDALQSTAKIPGGEAGAFDAKWGHGLIDAAGL